jgi:PadR family transcriptional regulator PadR
MARSPLKGHLDLLILAVLAEGPKHGYVVIEELRRRSDEAFDLPEGTVYPALHRLEAAGAIAAEWSTASGRRRKTYQLTEAGRSALGEQRRSWEEFSTAVGHVLGGTPWPSTT